jgi:hypothetical protein
MMLYAAAHIQSSNPPDPAVKYEIDYSVDAGQTWRSVVRDWSISRRGDEPHDFWSQSFCWGSAGDLGAATKSVQVRFRNNGGKNYARCEAHLIYSTTGGADATRVTFALTEDAGAREAAHVFPPASDPAAAAAAWDIPTGKNVRTRWVEFEPVDRTGK